MKRFEEFDWEFDDEEDDGDFKIGDKVLFIKHNHIVRGGNRIPKYYCDSTYGQHPYTTINNNIPHHYIKHGSTLLNHGDYKAEIVHIYNDYYIVSYISDEDDIVQLGFLKDSIKHI